ncbi:MAG: tetratricopeptide repeat protein [Woeseiaceae bacterium]
MNIFRIIVAVLCLTISATSGAALKSRELADKAGIIEYAAHTGDYRYLTQLSELLPEQKARGDLQKLVHYYAALAAYRAAEIDEDVEFRVGVLLDRCVEQGKAALKLDREYTEALALIGACHGLAAARQPLAAIVSGNFSARELKRAVKLSPENPRVLLLQAVTLLRRYDDDSRRMQAREFLAKSIALYAQFVDLEQSDGPQWGEEYAHLWMARLAVIQGDKVLARDHLEKALIIAPQFSAASSDLNSLGG